MSQRALYGVLATSLSACAFDRRFCGSWPEAHFRSPDEEFARILAGVRAEARDCEPRCPLSVLVKADVLDLTWT